MSQPWLKLGLHWGWTLTCVLTLTALLAANLLCSGRLLDFCRCLTHCAARVRTTLVIENINAYG